MPTQAQLLQIAHDYSQLPRQAIEQQLAPPASRSHLNVYIQFGKHGTRNTVVVAADLPHGIGTRIAHWPPLLHARTVKRRQT